jgi:hypothetical protein
MSSFACDLTTGRIWKLWQPFKSNNEPSEAVDILAHTVAVSQLWLSRATGTPRPSSESVPSAPNPQQVETAVQPSMVPAESFESRNTGIIPRKAGSKDSSPFYFRSYCKKVRAAFAGGVLLI